MDSKRLKTLINGLRHPSGADLLMYTDGELPVRKSQQVERHLHACWQCRVELQRIAHAIEEFMDYRSAEVGQFPPLRGWSQFSGLLRSAAAEPEEPRRIWSGLGRLPHFKFAVAGAVAAALVVALYLRPVATVSANSLLDRAESAEVRTERGMKDPVVYRKIAFRRKASSWRSGQSGEIETWRDLDRAQYRQHSSVPLWPELEQVLERNHMAGRQMLSAAAFREWRNSLARRQESVHKEKLADGGDALTLTVTSETRQPDSILEASLVLRNDDWRPVEQSLRVQQEAGTQEYELNEISYRVMPRSSVDASIFATSAAPQSLSPATMPAPALASPIEPESSSIETEIQALYALHQANACLNDNIQVTRGASGRTIVQGTVETAQRKERITIALEPIQGVEVQIRTIEESQSSAAAAEPANTVGLDGTALAGESHAPIQDALKGKLSASKIADLSYRAVSLSEDWAGEAWALRRLAEAVPADDLPSLTKRGRAMLAEMVRSHTASLRTKMLQGRTEFEPYLPGGALDSGPETGAMDWPGSVLKLFADATRAADLTRSICAGSGPLPVPASDGIQNLVVALSSAKSDAAHLESTVAALLESRAQAVQSKNMQIK